MGDPPAGSQSVQREGVDDVLARGGGAPGVVAPMAELDVQVDAREGGAARLEAGSADVLLHEDLGREVGRLRPEDGERMAARGRCARDHQRVGCATGAPARGTKPVQQARDAGLGGSGPARPCPGDHDVRAPQRARIGDARPLACPTPRGRLVGEASRAHRRRRIGILVGRPLAPQALPAARAEARHEAPAQLHLRELVPAALAEDAADQRGGRDEVRAPPWRRSEGPVDGGVLPGQLGHVEPGLGDVRVDARDVAVAVLLGALAVGAVELVELVGLAIEVVFRVGGDPPLLGIHGAVARGPAGEGGELSAARVAQHVHEEEPVLRGRVAQAEHRRRARGAGDVGHPEVRVAHDLQTFARAVAPLHPAGGNAQGGVLEQAAELIGGDARRGRHQARVQVALVVVVTRPRPERQERGELDGVGAAVRARRKDVVEATGVRHLGRRRRAQRQRTGDGRQDRERASGRHGPPAGRGARTLPFNYDAEHRCPGTTAGHPRAARRPAAMFA